MTDLTDAGLRERASGVLLKWKTTEVCSLDECGTPQHEMQQVDLLVTLFTEDYIALRDAARAEQREQDAKIGDERAAAFGTKHAGEIHQGIESYEGAWWRARRVEAQDYAGAIRAQGPPTRKPRSTPT